ncbi:alpha/beta fold hydrolase [Glutamicibacter creatinolyticus]|uniref:alpha/beta fold hydrolase n=1 Tax=Glutamicibacter creatinolyticus TaxID=162496 RepID=UPI00321767C0
MAVPQLTPSLLHLDASLPTLILGPSLGTGALHLWGPAVPHLKDGFQLIAWDLPGHGASQPATQPFTMTELAQAVMDMIQALRVDGVIDQWAVPYYAGVSVGGAIALQLAHDHPGAFQALSVVCSAAKIGTEQAWNERADLVAAAGTPTMVVGSAQRWFAPGFIEKDPVTSTNLLHNLQDADRFSYAHVCRALAGFDLREELAGLTDPLLALNGAHDQVCPPSDAQFIAEHAPRGRCAVIESVAHLAPAEDPQATARQLSAFFTAN